ncbi:hypothetical protein A8926_6784 [Saccharopolyspora spinosa]|uniref:DNA-directed RNA polymerase specialized sigma24 family protein n=2 Tax=Saccharopolyspora spinosa TaxID=60894 RepID=A0A2N3Y711_SACSN|nr:hypothetical protein A8926_6784 [Saccharopolyspora spinosa]
MTEIDLDLVETDQTFLDVDFGAAPECGEETVCDLDEVYEPLPPLSVLNAAENAFRLLSSGPDPLAVDGAVLGRGLPARRIPLGELRSVLLHPATSHAAREAAWRELVCSAQERGAAWVVGAVGVALPGLRNIAGQLATGYTGDVTEVDAAVLAGFTERIKTIDPDAGMLAARLVWAAQRAGAKTRAAEWDVAGRMVALPESIEPPPTSGHPDLVLAEAVRDGCLTEREAAVIGASRLEGLYLRDLAGPLGLTYRQICYLREKAERKLVAYLTDGAVEKISAADCESAA